MENSVISVDAQLVTWESADDKENPKNWAKARKWRATLSISAFVLMNTLSSTIVAPALPRIADTLHVTNEAEETLILSIFVLGFAFGPFLACPLSEVHGRRITIQSWNLLYLIFNTACGPVNSAPAMLVLRFLAGFFCSASQGVSRWLPWLILQKRTKLTPLLVGWNRHYFRPLHQGRERESSRYLQHHAAHWARHRADSRRCDCTVYHLALDLLLYFATGSSDPCAQSLHIRGNL